MIKIRIHPSRKSDFFKKKKKKEQLQKGEEGDGS